jgi:hypothetical protein
MQLGIGICLVLSGLALVAWGAGKQAVESYKSELDLEITREMTLKAMPGDERELRGYQSGLQHIRGYMRRPQ